MNIFIRSSCDPRKKANDPRKKANDPHGVRDPQVENQ